VQNRRKHFWNTPAASFLSQTVTTLIKLLQRICFPEKPFTSSAYITVIEVKIMPADGADMRRRKNIYLQILDGNMVVLQMVVDIQITPTCPLSEFLSASSVFSGIFR
jgi:hypothetical protein